MTALTAREHTALWLLLQGFSNRQIAYVMGISERTLKNYMDGILRKLSARSRTHAVALAWEAVR